MNDIATVDAPAGADGAMEAHALAREFIWENLESTRRLCVIGQDFLATGDDVGARYALQRIIAHVRTSASTFKELGEASQADAPRKSEAA